MPTDGYCENDPVRVVRALTGEDPYTGKPVSVPAGEVGTVIVGSPGRSSFDVEFVLSDSSTAYSAVLIVQSADLAPYTENATH